MRRTLSLQLVQLRRAGLGRVLIPIACFELGNPAATLLILRATGLLTDGSRSAPAATSIAILLYAAHNAVASATSLLAGQLCDRLSPRLVFLLGAAAYLVGYAGFAAGVQLWPVLLAAFALAGAGIGFAETAQSTAVAQALPDELRGNGFGVLGLTQAVGDLGSTVVAGVLWTLLSPIVTFGYAAAWMLASIMTTALLHSRRGPIASPIVPSQPGSGQPSSEESKPIDAWLQAAGDEDAETVVAKSSDQFGDKGPDVRIDEFGQPCQRVRQSHRRLRDGRESLTTRLPPHTRPRPPRCRVRASRRR